MYTWSSIFTHRSLVILRTLTQCLSKELDSLSSVMKSD